MDNPRQQLQKPRQPGLFQPKTLEADYPLRQVLEAVPAALLVTKADGSILFVNQYFKDQFGFDANQDVLGLYDEPGERKKVLAALRQHNSLHNYELRIRRADGSPAWALLDSQPFVFEGVAAILSSLVDITARKEMEQKLLKNEERYQSFISQSFEGIYRTEFDHPIDISLPVETQIDLIYVNAYMAECNQALAAMYGLPDPQEMIGFRLIEAHKGKDNPDNRASFRKLIENGYRSNNDETLEYRTDGRPVWFLSNTLGIIENGHLVRLWGTALDITERKQAEQIIAADREGFKKIFAAVPVGLLLLDSDTVVTMANKAVGMTVLRDPVEIIGKRGGGALGCIHSLEHPRGCGFGRECANCPLRQGIESIISGKSRLYNAELNATLFLNGKPQARWLNVNAEPVEINGQQHTILAVDDITERKQAEAQLARQVERLRVLHTIDQAVASSTDVDLTLTLLVQKVVEELSVDACAILLLNHQTQTLDFAAKQGFRTEALEFTSLNLGVGLAGKAAERREVVYWRNLGEAKDIPALTQAIVSENFVSYVGIPLIAKDSLLGVLEIFHRTELEADSEWLTFLETLADQAAIALDDARLLGMTQQRLKETSSLYRINQDLIATVDPDNLMQNVVDLLQMNFGYYYVQILVADPKTGDFVVRAGSGELGRHLKAVGYRLAPGDGIVGFTAETGRPFFTNDVEKVISFIRPPLLAETKSELAVPIKIGNRFLGMLDVHQAAPAYLTNSDIQLVYAVADQLAMALQKAELYADLQEALYQEQTVRSQLIHSEKLAVAGRLLASVSHELNNPIQAIQNALFLLKEEKGLSSQGRQDLEIVLSETERMATMLERLRTTYRPASAEDFRPVQVNKLIEDVCSLVATHLRHNQISYSFQADPHLPSIPGLESQLRQVILNLFMNSVDAMPNGGHLSIATQALHREKEVLITVADTGPGIADNILPNIFEAFVTNKERGTGLGLTISYEIVSKHQGRIQARNNPEQGAMVNIWLPLETKKK